MADKERASRTRRRPRNPVTGVFGVLPDAPYLATRCVTHEARTLDAPSRTGSGEAVAVVGTTVPVSGS